MEFSNKLRKKLVQDAISQDDVGGQDLQMHLLTSETRDPLTPNIKLQTLPSSDSLDYQTPPLRKEAHKSRSVLMAVANRPWEDLNIILSAAAIIAIVILLHKYNGKQPPEWKYISLNSVLSWLSTISKACVLYPINQGLGQLKWLWFMKKSQPLSDLRTFDSASRGGIPGSLDLLWTTKGSHFAVFGSLAIILGLAFEPFTQNLIHYVSSSVNDPSQIALLGNTSVYNVYGPLTGADNHYVDPILKANVYSALFNVNPSQPWAIPQYTCPTGNCTWDPMASLEMRALCSNVTSKLQTTCNSGNCTVSLETGLSLWYNEVHATPMVVAPATKNSTIISNYSSSLVVIQYILAAGSNNNSQYGGSISQEINNNTQFIATECALTLVVSNFRASVSMGTYHETLVSEWTTQNNNTFNDNSNFEISLTPSWHQEVNQTFGIVYEAWESVSSFLEELFEGSITATSDVFEIILSNTWPYGPSSYATSDCLEAIFYGNFSTSLENKNCSDQLSCALTNVAAAISKIIRDAPFNSYGSDMLVGNTTIGQTMITVPFVIVHWEWISLPIVIWLLGLLTWLGAVWKTRRARVPMWTNDPLPLLFLYQRSPNSSHTDSAENDQAMLFGKEVEKIRVKLYTNQHDMVLAE